MTQKEMKSLRLGGAELTTPCSSPYKRNPLANETGIALIEAQMKIKVAQFGLGPIGLATANLAASKQWLQVVGAVDIDPAKEGKDLGELAGHKNLRGVRIYASIEELLKQARPNVVLHTTVSKFNQAFPQLEAIAKHGISVVSSCEELVFPQLSEPHLGKKLDALC